MADNIKLDGFFGEDKPNNEEIDTISEDENSELEKITVGDQEYTQEELDSLIGLGKIAREVEEQQGTKIDRVWPEYTKSRQELKSMREELERVKSEQAQRPALPENEEQAIREAKEAAKKLGIVTTEDFSTLLKESFRDYYLEERNAERLLDKVQGLETKYDGVDGRPKADAESILEYMQESGVRDPEAAYKLKFEEQLAKWQESQLGKARKPGLTTLETTDANKQPKEVKITNENFGKLLAEELGS